jgi:hypothetical protein
MASLALLNSLRIYTLMRVIGRYLCHMMKNKWVLAVGARADPHGNPYFLCLHTWQPTLPVNVKRLPFNF